MQEQTKQHFIKKNNIEALGLDVASTAGSCFRTFSSSRLNPPRFSAWFAFRRGTHALTHTIYIRIIIIALSQRCRVGLHPWPEVRPLPG